MKIKKPMKVKAQGAENAGGAAIADRFRLDPVEPGAPRAGYIGRKSALTALIFGLVALATTIALTIIIYQHWEFLMPV
ncbi:MAG: hypothetical protein IJ829_06320 [Kiritimatiellae bacterium]|nr:hypothetical protein [Kiritimatiellia bacterium]